jgi:hypothetical protein
MMASGCPLSDILGTLCRVIEENGNGCLCGVVPVDSKGDQLEHGAAPRLPRGDNEAIHGRPINADSGPCAMAAFLKTQVIATDVA